MRGGQDCSNVDHCMALANWTSQITSKYALRLLSARMDPAFFEKLMGIVKRLFNDQLEAAALEGYFHSLVRHQRSMSLQWCTYDHVKWLPQDINFDATDNEKTESFTWNSLPVVVCSGKHLEVCINSGPLTLPRWIIGSFRPGCWNLWMPLSSGPLPTTSHVLVC